MVPPSDRNLNESQFLSVKSLDKTLDFKGIIPPDVSHAV